MDWPWHYRDRLDHPNMRGAAEDHYSVLKPNDLCKLNLDAVAADDCALFFWITSPQFDVAFRAFDHWIARQKAEGIPKARRWSYTTVAFVWRKMNKKNQDTPFYGLGRWSRSNYEYVLLLTKGKPQRISKGIRQEIEAPIGRHSSKPEAVRESIVELMGDVPRLELFARNQAEGWQATGLDLDGIHIEDTVLWRNE